ncbi:MAG: thioredoxin family protein [Flavobacteriia bacterium]|nr:thioredoxin family protein [Flavobacteriia bacterium]
MNLKNQFNFFSLLLLFFVFVSAKSVSGQIEYPEDKVKWKFSVEQKGEDAFIIAEVKMETHWHINSIVLPKGTFGYATKFNLTPAKTFKLVGSPLEPKPILKHDDEADEDLSMHEGKVIFKQKIKVISDKDFIIKGSFSFQTCDETHCLAPYDGSFKVAVKGLNAGVSNQLVPTTNISNTDDSVTETLEGEIETKEEAAVEPKEKIVKVAPKSEEKKSLLGIFIISFISGLAALFTPCVFPMIPMTVSFFTKQSKSKAQGIKNASIFGISIILIYITLGTAVTAIFGADALNKMSTNPWFNFVFFVLLVVFAISFLGAFEIRMPSSWVNKADAKADKGGLIGIFFMALALALVSFSCTGPIVGSLIVEAASVGGITPIIGMFGFSLALALPFALFAMFPGWLNSMPKSGGWLNSVKVVLGFLELALAFKFLSNADMTWNLHMLEREMFIGIWIAVFTVLTLYLFGKIRMPHDSPLDKLSVGRVLLGTTTLLFVIYMIPGMWGAPLKIMSAFPPPIQYSESPTGFGGGITVAQKGGPEGTHLGPQNINVFHDYDKALAYAKEVNKPLFVDFTGINCVNCRKMEQQVWGEEGILDKLTNEVVIVSLHVDERVELPKNEQGVFKTIDGRDMTVKTTGDKWKLMQINRYNILAQPYYVMQDVNGKDLTNGSADYEHTSKTEDFKQWLNNGLKSFQKKK